MAGPYAFSDEECRRYARHFNLAGVGREGQSRLRQARVLVVGCGGLGSPAAYYLTAAGVGTLGLVDADAVDVSNLQRQILHTTRDIGKPKVISAMEKLRALNPNVRILAYQERLHEGNAEELISRFDVVVDACDNFETRLIANEVCVRLGKPFVHGAVLGFIGQVMTVMPGQGPCYRCLFGDVPGKDSVPGPDQVGLLAPIPGVIGSIQAVEAMKVILGLGDLLVGRMLIFDGLRMDVSLVQVGKDPSCAVCSEGNRGGAAN